MAKRVSSISRRVGCHGAVLLFALLAGGCATPEDLRLVAVARLILRPGIQNIQVSWVKMGPKMAQVALLAGANDLGGTLMEESISRESGSQFGEKLPPEGMRRLIREIGRTPVERSTT